MQNADRLATGSKPAPGSLAYLQGFVNTIDLESGKDDLGTPEAATKWFTLHGLLPDGATVSPEEQRRSIEFREALRALLRGNSGDDLDPEAVATIERLAANAPLTFHVTFDGAVELQPTGNDVAAALARLLATAYAAMLEGTWPRLKACANHDCQWAFFDHSRNHSGTWCSMDVCGNRMKVRSHRERKAAG
ncbi:MAG: CGNR zinc finger domain-containing protein [Trueperaceae bacterium]